MTHYAYFVNISGQKRWGGTVSATSMDDAALRVAKLHKLTLVLTDLGTHWQLEDKKANVAIWASADLFLKSDLPRIDNRTKFAAKLWR